MDDSDKDSDFIPTAQQIQAASESTSDEDAVPTRVPRPIAEVEPTDVVGDTPGPKRSKRAAPMRWKKNTAKLNRLQGVQFTSLNDTVKAAKVMGPPCESAYCQKSKLRACQEVTNDMRHSLFNRFWKMESWSERRTYVKTAVTKIEIKQKKSQNSRRPSSFAYNLKMEDGTALQVCKSMFASTLGLSQRTLGLWLNPQVEEGATTSIPKSKVPKTGRTSPFTNEEHEFVVNWLADLPVMPSHYCRHVPTYKEKKFLYPGTTLARLHTSYKVAADEQGIRSFSSKCFSDTFHELNYSVFIPRKDQCDVCVSAKHNNIDNESHAQHIKAKDEARAEKSKDKENANASTSVWTMDLQAVLLCPNTKASAMYYKTKLQVHNFTLFNLATKEGFCYTWDESEGSLSSEVFASIIYQHFFNYLDSNPGIKEIVIWSDGCGYQNRNTIVSNSLLQLTIERKVTILQKFLVSGHTQMECDSMHSTIERRRVCDVYNPRDYVVIMETARMSPAPYIVRPLDHTYFKKLSGSYLPSIRPGKKAGDPTVHMLRGLKYEGNGKVHYTLKFEPGYSWNQLPQRVAIPSRPFTWEVMFQDRLPIKERKYADLQSMKHILPVFSHPFFDDLPH